MSTGESAEARAIARRLLRQSRQGALATLRPKSGAPYCSLVAVASHPDGSPLLLISRLAVHTQNLLGDPRASLLLSDVGVADPLQEARIMITARADVLEGPGAMLARRRYLAVHPAAEMFVDFADFLFVRLSIEGVHLVAGFGRISDLAPGEIMTDLHGAEALVEAEEGAVQHMNDDHADALVLYASQFGRATEGRWRCSGLDPDGLDLESDGVVLRVDFPARVATPGALRVTLAKLAAEAREKATRR